MTKAVTPTDKRPNDIDPKRAVLLRRRIAWLKTTVECGIRGVETIRNHPGYSDEEGSWDAVELLDELRELLAPYADTVEYYRSGSCRNEKRAVTPLPKAMAGHWETPEGREIAVDYLAKDRGSLCMGNLSDFHLANAQYLEDISVGTVTFQSAIGMQTAAKERIRWLSAQLAAANIELGRHRIQSEGRGGAGEDGA